MLALRAARALRAAANLADALGARRAFREAPTELPEAYDFVDSLEYGEVRLGPVQVREEMLRFLALLSDPPPRSLVEIGTARGGSLFLFTRVAAADATIVTIDMPAGPFGGGYPRMHAPLLKSFRRDKQRIHLVRGESGSPGTFQAVRSIVGDTADLLFIDADHTYEGVRGDFETYAPLVRPGGLIAFHDIVDGPPEAVGGVPRFWKEIREQVAVEEIVADWAQGGYGIGLIRNDAHTLTYLNDLKRAPAVTRGG
jgi:predicted O-methyltransferase YrrM